MKHTKKDSTGGRTWQLMWQGAARVAWIIPVVMLLAGCASTKETRRSRDLLALHPSRETVMTAQATNGYTPAGVWRVRGVSNTVYIAGTYHVVTRDQIPFPTPFYAAYNDSTEIYLEVNEASISTFSQIRYLFKMIKWMKGHGPELYCPKGKTLADYLQPQTVARLKELYGKKYRKLQGLTPMGLAFQGEMEYFMTLYKENSGVDETFALMARRDRKPIRELDDKSVDAVVWLMLDEMLMEVRREIAEKGPDKVIAQTALGEREPAEEMETHWRRGELTATEKELDEVRTQNPTLYASGIQDRNRKWLEKLRPVLHGNRTVMVLVGFAHMAGPDGLIRQLREAGYTVEQLHGIDPFKKAQSSTAQ